VRSRCQLDRPGVPAERKFAMAHEPELVRALLLLVEPDEREDSGPAALDEEVAGAFWQSNLLSHLSVRQTQTGA
jgi:hypothetical protein